MSIPAPVTQAPQQSISLREQSTDLMVMGSEFTAIGAAATTLFALGILTGPVGWLALAGVGTAIGLAMIIRGFCLRNRSLKVLSPQPEGEKPSTPPSPMESTATKTSSSSTSSLLLPLNRIEDPSLGRARIAFERNPTKTETTVAPKEKSTKPTDKELMEMLSLLETTIPDYTKTKPAPTLMQQAVQLATDHPVLTAGAIASTVCLAALGANAAFGATAVAKTAPLLLGAPAAAPLVTAAIGAPQSVISSSSALTAIGNNAVALIPGKAVATIPTFSTALVAQAVPSTGPIATAAIGVPQSIIGSSANFSKALTALTSSSTGIIGKTTEAISNAVALFAPKIPRLQLLLPAGRVPLSAITG
jgi:hypothetical protein